MLRRILALILILFLALPVLAPPVAADGPRVTLGYGRLFANDQFGDGRDRWRTGSWSISVASGHGWDGNLPSRFGDVVELRFRAEIIAPRALSGPQSGDRPYVGALTYGMHSHWAALGGEFSAGVEVTMTGPQTGIADFQNRWHRRLSSPTLSDAVVDGQIGDGFHPSVTLEYGRPLQLSARALVRPFVEVQAGIEQIARVGVDVILGPVGQADLMVRDQPTGQLYRVTRNRTVGLSLVAGADWARVGDSLWLPEDQGFAPLDERWRARVGALAQVTPWFDVFAGLTYLSEEFVGQPEGQTVAAVTIGLRF
jgi:hypothetical protein